jgi:hypothetical protein
MAAAAMSLDDVTSLVALICVLSNYLCGFYVSLCCTCCGKVARRATATGTGDEDGHGYRA